MPMFVCCRVDHMKVSQTDEGCFGLKDWKDRKWICLELTQEGESFANLEIARLTSIVAKEFFDEEGALFQGRVSDRGDLKYALAHVECSSAGGSLDIA